MEHKKSRIVLAGLGISILATAVFIGGFMFASGTLASRYTGSQEAVSQTRIADAPNDSMARRSDIGTSMIRAFQENSRQVAQKALPFVVRVDVLKKVVQPNNPFRFFFNGQPMPGQQDQQGDSQPEMQGGFGSGIIIQQTGETVYVLTNNHVVDGADKYTIRTHDDKEFEGKLVGADKNRDIAVISFASKDKLSVAVLADSSQVQPGDIVFAVGSPYGIQNTITQGIISAINRNSSDLPSGGGEAVSSFTDYIQTDAAINPGNSGGALVDIDGNVIGVNTWIATRTGENVGLGFAVPINNARKVAMDFITKGKVEYGWLGVAPGSVVDSSRQSMKLDGKDGAFVYNLIKSSPADKAGLLPGDLITKVDNVEIKSSEVLVRIISGLESQKDVKVTFIREGREQTATVRLGVRDESIKSDSYWPGFTAFPLTDEMKQRIKTPIPAGTFVVMSVEEGTIAADAGLRPGDEIVTINSRKVGNAAEFYQALNTARNRWVDMKIKRNGREITLSWQG